eukprot:5102812-Prymnesium_polylepis.3
MWVRSNFKASFLRSMIAKHPAASSMSLSAARRIDRKPLMYADHWDGRVMIVVYAFSICPCHAEFQGTNQPPSHRTSMVLFCEIERSKPRHGACLFASWKFTVNARDTHAWTRHSRVHACCCAGTYAAPPGRLAALAGRCKAHGDDRRTLGKDPPRGRGTAIATTASTASTAAVAAIRLEHGG